MKFIFFLALSILMCISVSAQKITYQKTFQEALDKAAASNKPIFLAIHPPLFYDMPTRSGIDAPEAVTFYNQNFISYGIRISDTLSRSLIKKYEVANVYPCYLFLDSKGNLLYRATGNFVKPDVYISIANKAIERLNSDRTLSIYDAKYKSEPVTGQFLKDYISLREELGLFNNARLIDEYVNYITINSFQNYHEVLFVLKAGPYAFGKAYSLCFSNRKIADSIYKTEPLQLRQAINNRIINNTNVEAIRTKNPALAQQASSFSSNIWGKDFKTGYKKSRYNMLYYYQAVHDTTNYYLNAANYYDDIMRITVDSTDKIKQKNAENIKRSMASNLPMDPSPMKLSTDTIIKRYITTKVMPADRNPVNPTAAELNTGAWNYYILGTRNPNYLTKALLWSKRSILLEPENYNYYDTLAHLLYRLELFSDADFNQGKAIILATEAKSPQQDLEKFKLELKKIKEHRL